jgi:hypothetical protein
MWKPWNSVVTNVAEPIFEEYVGSNTVSLPYVRRRFRGIRTATGTGITTGIVNMWLPGRPQARTELRGNPGKD